ncbi:class I SAM-dependent methyltransferase [uncultured Nocardioides sp.]|uniref:class I SAM-dependent methyltransferase n=1 Tax=uncultured Nocardioides sp. TaxID=198441 RepID=UPI0026070813|nr:methyltransferase domain-containing protein [uncultured Nocardioides sp.]
MSWWERRVVPRLVEKALSSGDVRRERALACSGLSGRVLEVGFGSGLNLPHLPPEATAVDAVEPSDLAWEMSAARRSTAAVPVTRVGLNGQRIDADSAAYDSVLCTFSLCTIPDAALAAREMARLVRPGGTVHVLEHGLSPDGRIIAGSPSENDDGFSTFFSETGSGKVRAGSNIFSLSPRADLFLFSLVRPALHLRRLGAQCR